MQMACRIRRICRRFIMDENGSYAIIFAVAAIPLFLAAGAAIDYGHALQVKSHLQNATDSAAFAAAKEPNLSDRERKRIARKLLKKNFKAGSVDKIQINLDGPTVTVTANASVPTSFMQLARIDKIPISVDALVSDDSNDIEIALVLDVSGSMRHSLSSGSSRIDELKKAAISLVDKLTTNTDRKVKVAVVPFTMNVNIGTANSSFVTGSNHAFFTGTKWMGCVQERAMPKHVANEPGGRLHAYIWPPSPDDVSSGICKNPSNGTNDGYATLAETSAAATSSPDNAQFDDPNRNCVRHAILPLSKSVSTVKTYIQSLTSRGNDGTIIAPGVTWGLRALSPEWPFSEGDDWKKPTAKVMIVLTDGEQTTEIEYQGQSCPSAKNTASTYAFDPATFKMSGRKLSTTGPVDNWTPYGFIADSDPFKYGTSSVSQLSDALHSLSLAACSEAKKKQSGNQIEIFTIGVSDATRPGTRVYDLLNQCASTPKNHFYVKDNAAMTAAFDEIAEHTLKLRLAR